MPIGPFFADFLGHELKLIVELDGFSHDVQPERDVDRDVYPNEQGFCVLHFSNADVMSNVESVVVAIRDMIGRMAHP